jgi:hypothetical protein
VQSSHAGPHSCGESRRKEKAFIHLLDPSRAVGWAPGIRKATVAFPSQRIREYSPPLFLQSSRN